MYPVFYPSFSVEVSYVYLTTMTFTGKTKGGVFMPRGVKIQGVQREQSALEHKQEPEIRLSHILDVGGLKDRYHRLVEHST
jgi:hypothetical protein